MELFPRIELLNDYIADHREADSCHEVDEIVLPDEHRRHTDQYGHDQRIDPEPLRHCFLLPYPQIGVCAEHAVV